jgi:hypothetical protein
MNDPHPDVLSHLLRKVDSPKNKMRLLRAYFPTAKNPVSAASRSGVNVAPVRENAAAYIQDYVRHNTKKRALKYIAAHDRHLVQEVVQEVVHEEDDDLSLELSWPVVNALKKGDFEAAKWIIDRYRWIGILPIYREISQTFDDSDKANVYFLFKNIARTKAEQVEMMEVAMEDLNAHLIEEDLTRIDMKFFNFIMTLATKFNLVNNKKLIFEISEAKKYVSDILRSHRDPQVKRLVSALNIPII